MPAPFRKKRRDGKQTKKRPKIKPTLPSVNAHRLMKTMETEKRLQKALSSEGRHLRAVQRIRTLATPEELLSKYGINLEKIEDTHKIEAIAKTLEIKKELLKPPSAWEAFARVELEDAGSLKNLARTLAKAKEYGEALRYLNRALELEESPDLYYHKAAILDLVGKHKRALKEALKAKALEEKPEPKIKVSPKQFLLGKEKVDWNKLKKEVEGLEKLERHLDPTEMRVYAKLIKEAGIRRIENPGTEAKVEILKKWLRNKGDWAIVALEHALSTMKPEDIKHITKEHVIDYLREAPLEEVEEFFRALAYTKQPEKVTDKRLIETLKKFRESNLPPNVPQPSYAKFLLEVIGETGKFDPFLDPELWNKKLVRNLMKLDNVPSEILNKHSSCASYARYIASLDKKKRENLKRIIKKLDEEMLEYYLPILLKVSTTSTEKERNWVIDQLVNDKIAQDHVIKFAKSLLYTDAYFYAITKVGVNKLTDKKLIQKLQSPKMKDVLRKIERVKMDYPLGKPMDEEEYPSTNYFIALGKASKDPEILKKLTDPEFFRLVFSLSPKGVELYLKSLAEVEDIRPLVNESLIKSLTKAGSFVYLGYLDALIKTKNVGVLTHPHVINNEKLMSILKKTYNRARAFFTALGETGKISTLTRREVLENEILWGLADYLSQSHKAVKDYLEIIAKTGKIDQLTSDEFKEILFNKLQRGTTSLEHIEKYLKVIKSTGAVDELTGESIQKLRPEVLKDLVSYLSQEKVVEHISKNREILRKLIEQVRNLQREGSWMARSYLKLLEENASPEILQKFLENPKQLDNIIVSRIEKYGRITELKKILGEEEYKTLCKLIFFTRNVLHRETGLDRNTINSILKYKDSVLDYHIKTGAREYPLEKLRKVYFHVDYKGTLETHTVSDQDIERLLPKEDPVNATKTVVSMLKEAVKKNKGYWKKLGNIFREFAEEKGVNLKETPIEEIIDESNYKKVASRLLEEVQKMDINKETKAELILDLLESINWENSKEVRERLANTDGNEQIEWIRTYWTDTIHEPIMRGDIKLTKKTKQLINSAIKKKLKVVKAASRNQSEGTLRIELSEGEPVDIIKGAVSGDCTTSTGIALKHYSDPYTVNFRIYDGKDWVGNIYGGIGKTKDGRYVFVIDAIQFHPSHEINYLKRKDLEKTLDRILEKLIAWGSTRFDIVALGSFKSERDRIKNILETKERGKESIEVYKVGKHSGLSSLQGGTEPSSVTVLWDRSMGPVDTSGIYEYKTKQDKEGTELLKKIDQYFTLPEVQKEIMDIVGDDARRIIEKAKNAVIASFTKSFREVGSKQIEEMGLPKFIDGVPVPEKAKLIIPYELANDIKTTRSAQGKKRKVITALDYLIEAKEGTDKEVLKRYFKIAEDALANSVVLTEEGLKIDENEITKFVLDKLSKEHEKMMQYMKGIEEREKKKREKEIETVWLIDEETKKKIEKYNFLPDEILEAFYEYPDLLEDPEVKQRLQRVMRIFFSPPMWEAKIKEELDNTIMPMLESAALNIALRKKINDPKVRQRIQKLIEKIEKENL